jgi:hypothetical protein
MSYRNSYRFAAAILGMALGGSAAWGADSAPSQSELMDKINSLESEVKELKAQQVAQQAQIAAAQTPAPTASDMQQVIHDADQHTQLLDLNGLTAGWADRRFFIASDDGRFTFKPWVHLEIRESTSYRDDFSGGKSDTETGYEIRRARFGFDGNLFGKDFTYFINWSTNRQNGTLTVTNAAGATVGTTTSPVGGLPVLEEAWVKYNFHDTPWYIHVGQMHDPLDHENIVGSKFRQPEASIQGDLFGNTDTFTQAATLIFDNKGPVRWEAGRTDGIRAANTPFEESPNNGVGYDGGFAGRVELKTMGNWKDYDQMTALGDKTPFLVFGAGGDYSYAGSYNTISQVLDASYGSPCGLFAYVCFFGRYTEHNKGIPLTSNPTVSYSSPVGPDLGKDTYEPSFDATVSYLIDQKFEPFVRYEYLRLAGTPTGSQDNVHDISVGANYYFARQNIKFTGMLTYLPNGIPITDDSADILVSNRKAEIVFLTQLQLLL